MSSLTPDQTPARPAEIVGNLLASLGLFLGFLELFYRPFRIAPAALILVLIATVMTREHQRLAAVAVAVIGICFVVGVTLQIITHHPMY